MNESPHQKIEAVEDVAAVAVELLPYFGPLVASTLHVRSDRKLRKMIRFQGQVIELLGGRVERLEASLSDNRLGDLVDHGIDLASNMREADQRQQLLALARIVVFGLRPESTDRDHNRAHLLMDVVARLQPEHVEVLIEIAMFHPLGGNVITNRDMSRGKELAALEYRVPEAGVTMISVVAWLESLGLVREKIETERPSNFNQMKVTVKTTWVLTNFGSEILDYLADQLQVEHGD